MTSREDLLALFAPATRPVTLLNGHTVHVREVSVEDGETMAQRLAGCTTEHQRLVVMAGVYLSDQHGQPVFMANTPDDQAVLKRFGYANLGRILTAGNALNSLTSELEPEHAPAPAPAATAPTLPTEKKSGGG